MKRYFTEYFEKFGFEKTAITSLLGAFSRVGEGALSLVKNAYTSGEVDCIKLNEIIDSIVKDSGEDKKVVNFRRAGNKGYIEFARRYKSAKAR